MYIYQAEARCDSCGQAICEKIRQEGHAPPDPDDERTYDSGEYPKSGSESESDGPQHCAAGDECLEAEELSSGDKIGCLLGTNLTSYGTEYLNNELENMDEPLQEFYREQFSEYIDEPDDDDDEDDGSGLEACWESGK